MRKKSDLTKAREMCDKSMQVAGMKKFKECEVCGKPAHCMHHFFPKSTSSRLRYDWDNLIPICQGCHMRHHTAGDPTIHATVIRKRGDDWYDELEQTRHEIIKVNVEYYKLKLEELNNE